MREKKAFKRAVSFLMSLVVAFTTFTSDYTLAVAADGNTGNEYPSSVTVSDNNLTVIKSAELNDEGQAVITFDVTAETGTEILREDLVVATDVVFVMDLSNSMKDGHDGKELGDNRKSDWPLTKAVNAAKTFAYDLLQIQNVRVGITSFGKYGYVDCGLTNEYNVVERALNGLTIGGEDEEGGTNIQAGLVSAQSIFDDANSNKIIVVLSDGNPTYSYKAKDVSGQMTVANKVANSGNSTLPVLSSFDYNSIKGNGKKYTFDSYTLQKAGWYDESGKLITTKDSDVSNKTNGNSIDSVGTSSTFIFYTCYPDFTDYGYDMGGYYYNYYYINSANQKQYVGYYHYDDGDEQGCKIRGVGEYQTISVTKRAEVKCSDNGYATISEAYAIKDQGIEIYSIGYNVSDYSDAHYVLKNVASKVEQYNSASSTNSSNFINNIVQKISNEIEHNILLAQSPVIYDEFPSYLTVTDASAKVVELDSDDEIDAEGERVPSIATDGKSVTWYMANAKSGTLTVVADINYEKMFEEYDAKDFYNGNMAKLNKDVTVSYFDKDENPVALTDITGNNVPYGEFETHKYTVNYYVDNEPVATTTGYAYEGKKLVVSDYQDYVGNNGSNKKYASEKTVEGATLNNQKTNYEFEIGNSDATVNVKYTTNKYDVTFEKKTAEGQYVEFLKVTGVSYGKKIGEIKPSNTPDEYLKDGFRYTFKNWDKDDNFVIKGNTTVQAQYSSTKAEYEVTFKALDKDGRNYVDFGGPAQAKVRVAAGATVSAPLNTPADITKNLAGGVAKRTFNGWYTEETCTNLYNFSTPVNDNITLYAGYTDVAKTYTVQYIGLDGQVYDTKTNVAYNSSIEDILYTKGNFEDETTKKVYFFNGWDKAGQKVNDSIATNGTVTVNAKKDSSADLYYTVTWVNDDTNNTELYKKTTVKYGTDASYGGQTPSKASSNTENYTFNGWITEPSGTNSTVDAEGTVSNVTSNITVKAQYAPSERKYTYNFEFYDANNEKVTTDAAEYKYDDTVSLPSNFCENIDVTGNDGTEIKRTFTGWSDYQWQNGITEGGTAVAQYADETWFTVTFVNEDGSFLGSKQVKKDTAVGTENVPTASKAEDDTYTYSFAGWKLNDADFSLTEGAVTESITLKASFTNDYKNYSLPVSIVGAGETVSYTTSSAHFDETVSYTLNIANFNQNGKKYQVKEVIGPDGFTTSDTTYSVQINSKTKNGSFVITLEEEPKFSVIYHNAGLTLNADGLDYSPAYATTNAELGRTEAVYAGVEFASIAVTAPEVEKTAKYTYEFVKWVKEDGSEFTATTLTENVHLYPVYSKNVRSYTVTFHDGVYKDRTVDVSYGEVVPEKEIPEIGTPEETNDKTYTGEDTWNYNGERIVQDIVIEATHPYVARVYTIHFIDWDKKALGDVSGNYGSEVFAISDPTRDDTKQYEYEFEKWINPETKEPVEFPCTIGNFTVQADYTKTEKEYTVYLYGYENSDLGTLSAEWTGNGFDASSVSANELAEAEETSLNDPEQLGWKFNYEFKGWKDADGKPVSFTDITSDVNAYADYDVTQRVYKVTYYYADGNEYASYDVSAGESHYVKKDGPTKLPDKRNVYAFDSWLDRDANNAQISGSVVITKNYDLVPFYTSTDRMYTIRYYDEDREKLIDDTITATYGASVDAVARPDASKNPTKSSVSDNDGYVTDYTFAGWDFENVTTIEMDTNAYATYSWVKYPTDPEALIDEIITITGKEETGNLFTNDSSIPEGTERVAEEVTNAKLYDAENKEIGTYSVSSNGDYTVTFTEPVENGYTIDVKYVLKGTKTLSDGSTEEYTSEELTSSIIAYVCAAKAITLEDKTGTYNGQDQFLDEPSNRDEFSDVVYLYNGQIIGGMPGFKDAGTYPVTVSATYEFMDNKFTVSDTAVLTINKADITVALAKDLTMVADEFPEEPEYVPTVKGIVDGDKELVNLTYSCELDAKAKASNGRYKLGSYDVCVNASISEDAKTNYNLTTENGLLTITAPKDDSKANFYVVIPGALKNLSKEPKGQSLTVVNQSDSNYFSTGKQFGFVYNFSPYKSVAEYFGSHLKHDGDKVELTVDNNFSADELANVNTEYTYQTKNENGWVLNTYKLKDIDWYVIKDYSALANDEKVSNWHVDGYAGTIELQAKTFAGKTFTHTYNGKDRAKDVKKEITEYINGQNYFLFGTGSYEIVKLDVEEIKNAGNYEVIATVKYVDGIDETIDPTFDVKFTEIVNKLTVSIPSVNETKTYDGSGFSKEYSFKTTAGDTIKYSASTNEVNAGKYNLKISVNESEYPNYTIKKDQTYKLTINKKNITVTVADATKTYGDWDPTFTIKSISDLASCDSEDAIKKNITLSRVSGENAGKYNIFVSSDNLRNYNISKVNKGKLTITPATLTVKVKNASKVYGDKNPSKYDVELSGFKFYDGYAYDLFKKAIVVDNTNTNANAGTYNDVLVVNVNKTNKNLANYKVTEDSCTPGDFTIKKANLWVDVKSASKTYGDVDPKFNYILTGLKNGDTKASIGKIEIVRTNDDENAGQYWNVLVVREGTVLQNYNIFSDKAHLTINPKAIDLKEVNPDGFNDEKIYDGEGYENTVSANGVNDEVVSIKLSTDKKDASETPYLLSAEVVDNANYVLKRSHYTLTINKRPISLESGSASKVYDGTPLTNTDVTVSGNGFVEGEGATYENFASITNFGSVENKFDVSFNENTKESNYDVTYVYGKLDVAKRHVDVYANDASKTQGASDPAFTARVENAIEAVAAFAWRISGNEAPGEYPIFITLGEPVNANYDIVVHEGTFTIYASEVVPGPIPGPTPGPTPTTVTPVPPTPEVVEEVLPEPEEVEEVEVVEEAVPEVEAPAEVVEIPEEEVPEAVASHCFIHWIILGITVLYALYAVLRMVQYKNENEDEEKQAENN